MSDSETEPDLFFVDDYEVDDIAVALRAMKWSDKGRRLVKALAAAPSRAMSRLELAQSIGSSSVNATNSALGNFAKNLALTLDPDLLRIWKPEDGSRGDWVMFTCETGRRPSEPSQGERDPWMFVMRESLAQALEQIGFAPFTEISDDAAAALWPDANDDESDDDDSDAEGTGPSVDPMDDIEHVREYGELDELAETEREAVIRARVGQGRFRDSLPDRWDRRCAVTGVEVEEALVASHIKPWFLSTNAERLDPDNGLLLVGTLDRLFDYGMISFSVDGTIMISPRVPPEAVPQLHLNRGMRIRNLTPATAAYLAYRSADAARLIYRECLQQTSARCDCAEALPLSGVSLLDNARAAIPEMRYSDPSDCRVG